MSNLLSAEHLLFPFSSSFGWLSFHLLFSCSFRCICIRTPSHQGKNMLINFSKFLASCAWSVLNLKTLRSSNSGNFISSGFGSRVSWLSVTSRTNVPSQCLYLKTYQVDWSAKNNWIDRLMNSSHKVT